MAINRNDLVKPELPQEIVAVPALGGEVIVRCLLLGERLSLFADLREDGKSYTHISKLLAATVVGDDGEPLMSEIEWARFGGRNFTEALDLFAVARRMSGLDAEVIEKN
jgi:hypothetical protein